MNPEPKEHKVSEREQLELTLNHAQNKYLHWFICRRTYLKMPDSKEWYSHLAVKSLGEEVVKYGEQVVNISQHLKRHQIK